MRLSSDYSEIKIRLKFAPNSIAPNFEPDWNRPPTAPMLVAIRSVNGERVPKMMKWGLIPHWAKDDKLQYSTFNARAEEFTTKPAFRDAWKHGQRCLVVTDGFYEWKKLDAKGKLKQPHAIAMACDAQMVMAGLWAKWKSPTSGEEIFSCTILTCEPNNAMGELHDRMPVILTENDWPRWLGEEAASEQDLLALLRPCPDAALKIWPVDKMVGNVKNNGPQLILPVPRLIQFPRSLKRIFEPSRSSQPMSAFEGKADIARGADVGPPYLLDILLYIKKASSRAITIKITHTIDPTIKRDRSAKGLAP